MWKCNVNSVVLLYQYLELASDKSTEIKTPSLGLEPHDITVIVYILQPRDSGILCRWDFSDGHSLSLGYKNLRVIFNFAILHDSRKSQKLSARES